MAKKFYVKDTVTKRESLASLLVDLSYEVSAEEGITEIDLDTDATLTSSSTVEVSRNGQLLFGGADLDYLIDVNNNKITFNYTIPKPSRINIKVFNT